MVHTPHLLSCKELRSICWNLYSDHQECSYKKEVHCRHQMFGVASWRMRKDVTDKRKMKSIQTDNGTNTDWSSAWWWKAFSSDSLHLMEKQSCILYWEVWKINAVPSVCRRLEEQLIGSKQPGGKCLVPSECSKVCN